MRRRVFISFPIDPPQVYEPLEREGYELIFGAEPSHPMVGEKKEYSEGELIGECKYVDAIIATPRLPLTSKVLNSAEKLFCICLRSVGFENIDIKTASELGIVITNAPLELNFISVAEHTVALILGLAKKLKESAALLPREGPSAYYSERVSPITLNSKTAGIVGLGNIGCKVATLLHPFGVKLLGYARSRASHERGKSLGVQMVDLDTLLKGSDFVTIHVPLTPETRHMIGARELALMKKTAYIINTARGAIIDEHGLIDALKSGKIAGAALDVLEKEPITSDNPLLQMDNVILTPHIAGRNTESIVEGEKVAVGNVLKIMKGIIPEHVVNPEAIPKWKERFNKRYKSIYKPIKE